MRPAAPPRPIAPPGITWTVHRERVLLAGWGRAILLQIAHPMVARGVAEHSAFTQEHRGRVRRLRRTLDAMLALTFGSPEEADATVARINGIHDRVNGHLDVPAGGMAAGSPYSAHDPALLAWVHATLLDSFLLTYRLFVRPLGAEEGDRYCAEAASIEGRLGIPGGSLPRTEAALRVYLDEMLRSGVIEVTDTARSLAREVIAPPAPWLMAPFLRMAALPAVGLLPDSLRVAYGFPWSRRHGRALCVMAAATRRGLPLVPAALRYWPAARRAARRARVERASW